ncbi:nickel-dependent hydrogenase large subunit [Methylosinus trichosporium]|uniref:Nickel-dependent hydrogenase large subunit n=2 Tax=Methylosinus TaxID=425 RepID=A0A2D2CWL2_METT3|nr:MULTISPECIES: nickel-dependent hydrogenase large subunit [Methylosinus]ATQ67064.1 nickel-dependent hydrogenase large subunit [Methylosinus trichosporium OB3b]OBS51100.1 hypothetical protein A8B73_18190 [Methylosinus sp. 3S-1]
MSSDGAFAAGAISIAVETADGRICSVRLRSSRPVGLARLFRGRPAEEAPLLAERLHALCGVAHGHAAASAIAAARGERPTPSRATTTRLLSERVAETLRSSAAMAGAPPPAPLRELLTLTRAIALDPKRADAGELEPLARALGLERHPCANTFFGSLWRACAEDAALAAQAPDALCAMDDDAVLAGLRRDGDGFSREPQITGRAPETGAFARHWREVDFGHGAALARLQARMIDLADTLARLAEGGAPEPARLSSPVRREGLAAVETARGALYHWARLGDDDKIADYAILAPTEWNFHPAGPFVASLLGARISSSSAADTITRLAALFDPCVAFHVTLEEAVHA